MPQSANQAHVDGRMRCCGKRRRIATEHVHRKIGRCLFRSVGTIATHDDDVEEEEEEDDDDDDGEEVEAGGMEVGKTSASEGEA